MLPSRIICITESNKTYIFNKLNFGINLDLQKSCKDRESYVPLTQFPLLLKPYITMVFL